MVRRFFKDSAVYALANITTRGLSLFLVPYYVRALTGAEMGTLDLLLAWGALAAVVTGLEISISMARDYAEQKDDAARREVASTALWFSVAVYGLFFIAVTLAAGPLAGLLLGDATLSAAVVAAAASVAAGGIFLIISQQLRYLMKAGLFAATSLTNAVVALLATVFFVSWQGLGVKGVFLGSLTGLAAGGVLAWYFTRALYGFHFNRRRCAQLLLFSLPLVPSSIAVIVNLHLNRLTIDHFLTREAVGVYGIAVRIGGIITLVMAGFGGAMAPLVFSRHAEKETPGNLARIFRMFSVAALLGTAGFLLFAPEALFLLATPAYAAALPAILILAPAALLSQMYIFAPGAWIRKRTIWITVVNVSAAVLNVLLNWWLVPLVGLSGAAWASLGSALISFGLNMVVSQHFYPVPHQWGRLAVAAAGTGALVACGMMVGGSVPWSGIAVRLAVLGAVLWWIHGILGLRIRVRH